MTERKQISPYPIKVRIQCPNYDRFQEAVEEFFENDPFETLIHECICHYIILESEWNVVFKYPIVEKEERELFLESQTMGRLIKRDIIW